MTFCICRLLDQPLTRPIYAGSLAIAPVLMEVMIAVLFCGHLKMSRCWMPSLEQAYVLRVLFWCTWFDTEEVAMLARRGGGCDR